MAMDPRWMRFMRSGRIEDYIRYREETRKPADEDTEDGSRKSGFGSR